MHLSYREVTMPQTVMNIHKLADTNLAGATAIRWSREAADKPQSHSEALADELLGPLDRSNMRVAALRQRLLRKQWPDGARIVPHLVPQIGVTHQLTPPQRVADTAFTSNNWSGSTISGTWAHAVGIWRVPSVSVPSTPPGTDSGWDSSSWVGIDGTYGSNDVLQAGVQQSVQADGSKTYVAWYEWFAPKVNGSPDYIYQTNINNMLIEPGDEVFAGVHYQNGQGFVMFGNVDRGVYFSIQLAAPPGATFSGNSVEWIVEAPNTGEPGTSLPRFTPVSFTAAFGSNANSTLTADPIAGDTTNIVAFGRNLTSVTLATDALTVDYLDAGFFPLPGKAVFDHGKQQIAAVSRASGNLDLFVIGFDNHVWSTFWNDQTGWNGDWFPLPGQAVFDREKQRIAAVSRASGNLDLFVIGFDNHVWSTFWNDQAGWNGDWFPLPGQAVFDREQQQIAAVSRASGNLDLFVIGFDNHVWSTFWNDQAGWNGDWFPLPGQAVFDREQQQIAAVSRAPGNLDLFVIGFDNHVWSTFWNDQTGWNGDWFPLPGQAVFDREKQRIAAVSRASGNLDLFVIGFDNHVWSTFWNDQTGWNGDWFPLPGQAVFDREKQRIAAVSRAPGNLDLFVIGFDNHVWSTFWNDQAGWNGDWFPLPGQAVFDRENQQVAAVSRAMGNLDLFLIGFDNHVWSEFWNDRVGWN
ncbi:G1 family glutamic endopeptidase [Paraburkholderia sp. 22099]|uniref:G1 family glutamic endopeptidase n=1 Tax=Paraburkholderia sp. 22099 TaxID=3453875 RepID=UPI003F86152E